MHEETLFTEALEFRDPAERAEFLDRACAGDAPLRGRLERLLVQLGDAGSFLGSPPVDRADSGPGESAGTLVGPYKLLQQIGEGGMGTVFLAEQTHPVRRKVALKLIKPGADSRQVLARFEAERQALALMDHPNIARVLDAGTTDRGRPYFVMELVNGVPITRYCDDRRLTCRERLELFVPVCQAVQHAHQKGIIHRDLKPSNVMVCLYDGRPVPKVIDFGVAKATGPKLTEKTLFTEFGSVVGTLEYMSPEQAELSQLDVDTRSDVYSLGVLLYELLTGTTPLERKQFREVAFLEVLRLIREEESPKPSTRLSTAEGLPSIAANRGLEPRKLSGLVRGELDWIVMKALSKGRDRRYESATAFAQDVERFLNHEPVTAGPPRASYRLRKFVRRNKRAVAVGVLVLFALSAGVVGTSLGLVEAQRQEAKALAERDDKETARAAENEHRLAAERERDAKARALDAEATARQRADEEAAVARAINDFLLKDLLFQAAPEKNARDKKVTVEELLERAAARVAGRFEKKPRIEAAIRNTIGLALRRLGHYSAAQPHLERALELHRAVLGEEHSDTLDSMNMLAGLYRERGQLAKAEPLFVKILELRRRVEGNEARDTLGAMNNLALLYQAQGRFAEAEPLYLKVLEVRRRTVGEEHFDMLNPTNNLALLYGAQGQYEKAEPLYVKALDVCRRLLGEEHPSTLLSIANLAAVYHQQDKFEQAEPLYLQAIDVSRRVQGEEHPETLFWMNNLGSLHLHREQFVQAEALYDKTLQGRRRALGDDHSDTLTSMNNLAMVYRAQGRFDRAEPVLRECLTIRERTEPDAWKTFHTKSQLGDSLLGQKKYADAEPLLTVGYRGMAERKAMIPRPKQGALPDAADRLVDLYAALGKSEEAARWRAERAKYSPEQAPEPRPAHGRR